jgi:hypothetical protein
MNISQASREMIIRNLTHSVLEFSTKGAMFLNENISSENDYLLFKIILKFWSLMTQI